MIIINSGRIKDKFYILPLSIYLRQKELGESKIEQKNISNIDSDFSFRFSIQYQLYASFSQTWKIKLEHS